VILANLLVARGARTLVLAGRRGATPELGAMQARGARVHVRAADVSDAAALARLLAEIDRDLPPLAGIVHAAGVLHDGTIGGLDRADPLGGAFGRTLGPKLDGGLNLHAATCRRPLDFMLLVSSAAVLLDSPGQGAYAAANAFLDALAEWRSRQELPTMSLRLGLVAGSTMLEQATQAGRDLASLGIVPLTEAEVAAAIPALWAEGKAVATLMGLCAERWAAAHPAASVRAYLSPLLPAEAPSLPEQSFEQRFGTGADAVHALGDALRSIVAAVTHARATEIAFDQPLRELGVDSLMTLQIRDQIGRQVGVTPRITDFWTYPTIDAFARHLAGRLGLTGAADTPASPVKSVVRDALADKWAKYL
jgi:acyl carrier protein/short-subunit dehydrogenase